MYMMTQIVDSLDDQIIQFESIYRPTTPVKNMMTCQMHNCSPDSSTYINNDCHCKDNITKDPLIDVNASGMLLQLTTPKRPINERALSLSPGLTSSRINYVGNIYLPSRCSSYNTLEKESTFQATGNFDSNNEDLENNILPFRKISNGLKIRINKTLMSLQNDSSYKSLSDLNIGDAVNQSKRHSRDLELDGNDMLILESSRSKEKRFRYIAGNNNNNYNENMMRNSKRKVLLKRKDVNY